MIHQAPLVVALAFAFAASTSAPEAAHAAASKERKGEEIVRWKEVSLSPAALPADFPPGARAACDYWASWAREHEYTMYFTDDARVVVFDRGRKFPAKEWKLVEDTLKACDALMPLPDRPEAPAPAEAAAGQGMSYSFGDVVELEHDTAAYFRLKDKEDFASMLEHVAKREEKDQSWVRQMEDHPGLLIYRPLAGAVVEAAGQEEWDPQNEMVNRIARLLAVRRFGRGPYWLTMGVAWHVEFELTKSIFCYPFRDSFVGVAEHGGWRNDLESQFRSKNAELDFNRLASWQNGTYDDLQAGRAWGTVSFAHARAPGSVGLVLEDLRLVIEKKGRIEHKNGTWELVPDFEPSPEDQLAVLEQRVDPKFSAELLEYFRRGMRMPKTSKDR